MLFERLVRRIGNQQVHGLRRQVAQPVDRIARREIEPFDGARRVSMGRYDGISHGDTKALRYSSMRNASFYARRHRVIDD
jgi:hypothetical protein